MEPDDLKSSPPDEAALETWLRTSATLPALPDNGFSTRVLTALPPAKQTRFPARLLACFAGAFAGMIVAAWPLLAADNRLENMASLEFELRRALELMSTPAMGLAIGVTVCSLLYVFWQDLRRLAFW